MPDIQYLGRACVRVRGKEGIVLFDPFPKSNGYDLGRPTAQIVMLSSTDQTHVSAASVKPSKDSVFVIDGPGEYEVSGVMINGIRTFRGSSQAEPRLFNTVYVIVLDDITFCHLGELGHTPTTHQLEDIGQVDVLFVPTQSGLAPDKIAEIIASIEPRVVVPLYDTPDQLEKLAHELGLKEWTAQEKLSVTAASLPGEDDETRVLVLQPGMIAA
jgi:L-ascorbate metabolism protein UlaG (beta-lactamase superfamily)